MGATLFGLIVEILVAILLVLTIAYCILLNRRLERLKSDEQALKATIAELITATEIAERAIHGLKLTVRDCDATLGERLRSAERFSAELDQQVKAGDEVVAKLGRIIAAARPPEAVAVAPERPVQQPSTVATLTAAQALAQRVRRHAERAA